MDLQTWLLVVFIAVVAFVVGKGYGIEVEKQRRAKEDARWRARQKGEEIDETERDWWLRH